MSVHKSWPGHMFHEKPAEGVGVHFGRFAALFDQSRRQFKVMETDTW